MVADVAYKPEDGETSSILEEPSRSSSFTLPRASTPIDELPQKEKKLQNVTQTPLNTRTTQKSRKRACERK